jgi:predicted transcriptional regulator
MKKKRKRVLQTKEVLELSKRLKIKNKTKKIKSLTKKKNIKYNLAQKYLILKRKENNWVL